MDHVYWLPASSITDDVELPSFNSHTMDRDRGSCASQLVATVHPERSFGVSRTIVI